MKTLWISAKKKKWFKLQRNSKKHGKNNKMNLKHKIKLKFWKIHTLIVYKLVSEI
jgi:hypothetical protein